MGQDQRSASCEICGSLPDHASTIQNTPLPAAKDQLKLIRPSANVDLLECPSCGTHYELSRHFQHDREMGDFGYENLVRKNA